MNISLLYADILLLHLISLARLVDDGLAARIGPREEVVGTDRGSGGFGRSCVLYLSNYVELLFFLFSFSYVIKSLFYSNCCCLAWNPLHGAMSWA